MSDSKTRCQVDISFNNLKGLENSKIVRSYLSQYAPLRSLTIVLKYFLQQRLLNEPYLGGLGSYALILMIVSFLQMRKRQCLPIDNFGVLLIDFLQLYGIDFNYFTTGIAVKGEGQYFNKIKRDWFVDQQPQLLSIEDPNDPENDVSRSSYNILTVRKAFEYAFQRLTRHPIKGDYAPTLLSRIIWVDNELHLYRQRIEILYGDNAKDKPNEQKDMRPSPSPTKDSS